MEHQQKFYTEAHFPDRKSGKGKKNENVLTSGEKTRG